MRENGASVKDIAREFGMVDVVIKRICARKDEMPKGSPYLDELFLCGAISKIAANDNFPNKVAA
jgi:hypothetical protein